MQRIIRWRGRKLFAPSPVSPVRATQSQCYCPVSIISSCVAYASIGGRAAPFRRATLFSDTRVSVASPRNRSTCITRVEKRMLYTYYIMISFSSRANEFSISISSKDAFTRYLHNMVTIILIIAVISYIRK